MDFKVNKLADGGNIAVADHNGIVNGSNSFIEKLSILANGREVYSCNYANRVVNIKNLLEYNPSYAQSVATNEFYFLDTSRAAEERPAQATYNKGFHARKALLGVSATVNCEIPLNRYSFFEALEDKLLPNTKIELNIENEKDANLIFQGADNCRVIITRLQLFIPKLTFNSEGQKLYMSPHVRESRTVLDSGFHAVDSRFGVLDSGFQHSGFRIPKRAGFHFFPGFNAFLRSSFSCSNLAILKDVVRRHNKFVFFFGLQNCGKKCITVP